MYKIYCKKDKKTNLALISAKLTLCANKGLAFMSSQHITINLNIKLNSSYPYQARLKTK